MQENGADHSGEALDRVRPKDGKRLDGSKTLNEVDQTLSDRDQTFSDRDQTLSDRDQQASDEDQDAAEHGGDVSAHDQSAAARAETKRQRLFSADERDDTAGQRDETAAERDANAAARSHDAAVADLEALGVVGGGAAAETIRLQDLREREDEARQRARLDRERAARDRKQAARDRELARRDREQARRDLDQAGTDELTGARRRGVGLVELQREISRAHRTGYGLVAAYIDVDGLKAVNDTYGHSAGDDLLRAVVRALADRMRDYDLLVRLGGDEFLCVLTDVTLEQGRERFDGLSSHLPAGPTERSVSIGLAELAPGDGPQELIDRADQDLLAGRAV